VLEQRGAPFKVDGLNLFSSEVLTRQFDFIQGGSNMTGTDLYVNKPHCAAAVRP